MLTAPSDLMRLALEVISPGPIGDLPISAVIVDEAGSLVSRASNAVVELGDSTAHAELLAIREAGMGERQFSAKKSTLVVTLEPCPMCAWAIRLAGIGRVVFGSYNPQYGAAGSVYDFLRDTRHGAPVEVVGGVLQGECSRILADAFAEIRNNSQR